MKKFLLSVFLSFWCLLIFPQSCPWSPPFQVTETFAPINDLAKCDWVPGIGYIIYYHPNIQSEHMGYKFFARAHEYAHIFLGHVAIWKTNPGAAINWNKNMELAADSQATNWLIESGCNWVVEYMISNFASSPFPNPPWYPQPLERAQNLNNIILQSGISEKSAKEDDGTHSSTKENPFSYFLEKSQDGFDFFKGKKENFPNIPGSSWVSNEEFPGATWTTVERSEGEEYLCASFRRITIIEAKEVFTELVEWAKKDLGDDWKVDIKKDYLFSRVLWEAKFSKISENVNLTISWRETNKNKQSVRVVFELK